MTKTQKILLTVLDLICITLMGVAVGLILWLMASFLVWDWLDYESFLFTVRFWGLVGFIIGLLVKFLESSND